MSLTHLKLDLCSSCLLKPLQVSMFVCNGVLSLLSLTYLSPWCLHSLGSFLPGASCAHPSLPPVSLLLLDLLPASHFKDIFPAWTHEQLYCGAEMHHVAEATAFFFFFAMLKVFFFFNGLVWSIILLWVKLVGVVLFISPRARRAPYIYPGPDTSTYHRSIWEFCSCYLCFSQLILVQQWNTL